MARILIGLSNAIKKNEEYCITGWNEQLCNALVRNGNDVLVYIPNYFHKYIFCGQNNLKKEINETALVQDIKNFNPDLVIAFNNSIYHNISNIVDCPIILWGADTDTLWNQQDLIKKNVGRYLFFCFSEQEMKPRMVRYGIPKDKIFNVRVATDLHNTNIKQDKNISFIGTNFAIPDKFSNFIQEFSGTNGLQTVVRTIFNDPFISKERILDMIKNEPDDFRNAFSKISQDDYILFFSGEKRISVLHAVSDLGLNLYGVDWKRIHDILPSLFACFNKQVITTAQENEYIYNSSKICINISHEQTKFAIPYRVCDIMASGGCLVSSRTPYFTNVFKLDTIPQFDSPEAAHDICKKLLDNDSMRQDIVAQCNDIIAKSWRFENRFKEIEQILNINLLNNSKGTLKILKPKKNSFLRFLSNKKL